MKTVSTVLPVWNAIQNRFHDMVRKLPEESLSLSLGGSSIGQMLRHNAEVEYMFAEWFFECPMPEGLEIVTGRGAARSTRDFTNLQELVAVLEASNKHLIAAMEALPEEQWHEQKDCPIGPSTPLESVGRLMYHAGIHSGQISLIQKCSVNKESAEVNQ
ncbi:MULTISPECIES: DinB family protein [unclassified Paenibacillus]|uniref:DinB family protein n=1 Tax=unclassified Paenibacillus TaxID=185978 RepID=UPI000838C220|nr:MULTISPECIES: DinB family protein [unclassified Paenibacillus]NWL88735.1 DinB family protein [Paenibacillus sp. 79R4]